MFSAGFEWQQREQRTAARAWSLREPWSGSRCRRAARRVRTYWQQRGQQPCQSRQHMGASCRTGAGFPTQECRHKEARAAQQQDGRCRGVAGIWNAWRMAMQQRPNLYKPASSGRASLGCLQLLSSHYVCLCLPCAAIRPDCGIAQSSGISAVRIQPLRGAPQDGAGVTILGRQRRRGRLGPGPLAAVKGPRAVSCSTKARFRMHHSTCEAPCQYATPYMLKVRVGADDGQLQAILLLEQVGLQLAQLLRTAGLNPGDASSGAGVAEAYTLAQKLARLQQVCFLHHLYAAFLQTSFTQMIDPVLLLAVQYQWECLHSAASGRAAAPAR